MAAPINIVPTREALANISKDVAVSLGVLPLRFEGNILSVAALPGSTRRVAEDLSFLTGKQIAVEELAPESVREGIIWHYGVTEKELQGSMTHTVSELVSVREEARESHEPEETSAVALANRIIGDAIRMRASDVHVEPYEKKLRVRYRLDGVLHEILTPSLAQARSLVSRLKIMADLDIAEKRRPQDGRIRVREGERTVDIRVSSLPTDFGEKIVLRILDKSHLRLDLEVLGFEPGDLRNFRRALHLPFGMILVTGPTGSGKTTTLYAALNAINRNEVNITTIEDPIEYNLPGINQTHVRSEIGLTFAAVLRSILRQDPNVIMVGEIRDGETAQIAVRAALTGHLVLSTLHTNDAPSAVTRLIDMGVEPFLVASSVKMILAQRLLRKVCPACRRPYEPAEEQTEFLSELAIPAGGRFYRGAGCPECHGTGYNGRGAVYELFPLQNGAMELVRAGVTSGELREAALNHGMVSLRMAALARALRGETTLEEIARETAL